MGHDQSHCPLYAQFRAAKEGPGINFASLSPVDGFFGCADEFDDALCAVGCPQSTQTTACMPLDSGAGEHLFDSAAFDPASVHLAAVRRFKVANGGVIESRVAGQVVNTSAGTPVVFDQARHVPNLHTNLVSVGRLDD